MKVPKLDLNFYSRVYDDFLEPETCDEYIELYEKTLKEESDKIKEFNLCYDKEGNKICTQCNCQRVNVMQHDRFKDLNKIMLTKFQSAVDRYKKDLNIQDIQFPKKHGWEDFKQGETVFPVFGDVVEPKKGRLLIFPPHWTYLHAGKPPVKPGYAKYFLGTYLTYE